jgi:hypothetical protein
MKIASRIRKPMKEYSILCRHLDEFSLDMLVSEYL